jgi:hypothetical protein
MLSETVAQPKKFENGTTKTLAHFEHAIYESQGFYQLPIDNVIRVFPGYNKSKLRRLKQKSKKKTVKNKTVAQMRKI